MKVSTQCCIVGGGPAGVMLGLLLAKAGVDVTVLEKHADFLRDFRGDTIHPSTLEVMAQLGILDEFLARPHQRVTTLAGKVGETTVTVADFSRLPTQCKFLAFMPQWDFLDFLTGRAKAYPTFHLVLQARAEELLTTGGRVSGVRARTPSGALEIHAPLTIGADGRDSVVRRRAGLELHEIGAPMDVLWLRLTKRADDPVETFGFVRDGRILALIDRGAYWQAAYVIPKGSFESLRARGIEALHEALRKTVPFLSDRVGEIASWDDVKLLTVRLNRLRRWYSPGVLCIGDAAHAMSPIGGVGINLAIQDAIAASNLLAAPLRSGTVRERDLRDVQRRREFPARMTQAVQLLIQRQIIGRLLSGERAPILALLPRVARFVPFLPRIPGYLVGLGFRPERVALESAARG
ncbi:MAG TPA: FAD-dependent oxidoreductase [Candidatus Acidoferrales bacterium]|nr:FAD-dependent oxidoreductase [Candidatus Acidoferrales bacterium]